MIESDGRAPAIRPDPEAVKQFQVALQLAIGEIRSAEARCGRKGLIKAQAGYQETGDTLELNQNVVPDLLSQLEARDHEIATLKANLHATSTVLCECGHRIGHHYVDACCTPGCECKGYARRRDTGETP